MKLAAPLLLVLALLSWLPLVNCAPSPDPDPGATGVRHSGDVPEAIGWRAEVVVTGLEHPWSIAWLPDGSALITERPGRLRIVREGVLDPTPIAGVPDVFAQGQGGLLDVAPHPDFADNRLIYLSYATGTKDANRTTVAKARFDGTRLNDLDVIFRNAETKNDGQHFGSRILWLADGSLLLSIGDGGNPPIAFAGENIRNQAQRLGTHFGKILRLTSDGQPHPGNPFLGRPGARPEIHTFGHRNIQGMALDPASGRVWANEHGSRGGDELNLIEPGRNYGWPAVTYSKEYWGPRISNETSRPGIPEPRIVWTPSKAPSGLAFYTGDRYPRWKGDLFSGALKFGQIRHIDLDGEQVIGEEKLTIGSRVRDVRQGPDGYLYVLTDQDKGVLLRILPTDG
ncbi:PQQ-dependent sugar dehydrogenase [Thiocystis violascens]|uniref:Glucose/sorbosone dehydrogenase n=1 Tax=Thiocystis violascens (strain ATCC 17096 / DSM 198 / 6111) TaxID=765911 RepID=I3YF95_THIV6|nr:PQQ-dependent sugar dehydrogenase [Thiocystis violascens]AFL75663.1 glucose/sorbosone dehydrogenase [Thiocystis violascens DSM 198]